MTGEVAKTSIEFTLEDNEFRRIWWSI